MPLTKRERRYSECLERAPTLPAKAELFNDILSMLYTYDAPTINDQLVKLKASFAGLQFSNGTMAEENVAENECAILLEKFYSTRDFTEKETLHFAHKIYSLNFVNEVQQDAAFAFHIQLLNKMVTRHRLIASADYAFKLQQLKEFRQKMNSSFSDKVYRYAIGFNGGIGNGSAVYQIASTLVFTVPIVLAFGFVSFVVSIFLAKHFIDAFRQQSIAFQEELDSFEQTIDYIASREAMIRLRCYSLISQIIKLHEEFKSLLSQRIEDPIILSLINNWDDTSPLTIMDSYINNRLAEFPVEISTIAEINSISFKKNNSIYTQTFLSQYWGPVLSSLGAANTLFSVTRTVLELAGVISLTSPSLIILSVIAIGAIVISAAVAFEHWQLNAKAENYKKEVKLFKIQQIDDLEIRADLLKRARIELLIDLTNLQNLIRKNALAKASIQMAGEVEKNIMKNLDFNTNGSHAGSRLVLFQHSHKSETERKPYSAPKMLLRSLSVPHTEPQLTQHKLTANSKSTALKKSNANARQGLAQSPTKTDSKRKPSPIPNSGVRSALRKSLLEKPPVTDAAATADKNNKNSSAGARHVLFQPSATAGAKRTPSATPKPLTRCVSLRH